MKKYIDALYRYRKKRRKQKLERQRVRKLKQYLRMPLGRKAYVLGSPDYSNLGDSAILLAQMSFLRSVGWKQNRIKELTRDEYHRDRQLLKNVISSRQPIFALGGGNMGNQWPAEEQFRYEMLDDFADNPIVIFPQTIYYLPGSEKEEIASVPYYDERNNLVLVAREKKSYEIMQSLYPKAKILLTADIVLSTTMEDYGVVHQERKGALLCVRNDAEKSVSDDVWLELEAELDRCQVFHSRTDMYSDCKVTKENRADCVRKKMQEFCGVELVITDRLHGMIFAAITGTPCIVFSNYNQKVKGTYDWISYLPYIRYVENAEGAVKAIPELLGMENCLFDNSPLLPYYEKLKACILEK